VSQPRDSAILVLDDSILRRNFFVNWLQPDPFFADTPEQATRILDDFAPNLIFLDYDLGLGIDSTSFALYLADAKFSGRIIISSENPFGMAVLKRILPSADIVPFSVLRKRVAKSWAASQTEIF
jgi:hypothetical protein